VTVSADLFDLSGRVIAVTGGLGRLGGVFARELASRGAEVVLLDLADARPAEPVPGTTHVACDVADRGSVERALARIAERSRVPDGLVNAAAIDSPPGAAAEQNPPPELYPAELWDQVMAVNVRGVLHCCQVIGGAMARAGHGSIVNIGSIYGMVSPDQRLYDYRRRRGEEFFKPVAYSASKAAITNLTRYFATYWGEAGVRVNTLTFGGVFDHQDPEFVAAYSARVPLGRMARADEYRGAVVFLLSDASSYMTGANLVLDGGFTAW
jgi:NAD(P)-dependent dehydrogenase (short-subunit alcohol dehydrogenase family)